MNRKQNTEPLLPGIPCAPTGKRFVTASEIDYQRRKRMLASRLPALKPEDLIGQLEMPMYQILLRDLMAAGFSSVADEINNLLRKEDRDRKNTKSKNRPPPTKLVDQPEVLQRIAETLKLEQTLLSEGKKESAMLICKTLADAFLLQERSPWLARHFYLTTLSRCRKICPKTTDRLQAEIHCLLAYIARENNENLESALAIAIDHLAVCRSLSREQNWQFKPNTILIRLKRPMAFYGISTDDVYEVVDACTMSLYMIASLLEHELLISLANQIMHAPHHKAPTDDDLKNAHEFADLALKLALEVRQPVALSSALTRFGIVLRHVGAYEDAMKYFQQLQQHAMLNGDIATEAIAFHNMGLCFIGMMNSVEALECFAKQKELSSMLETKELEGNSMHEIGHLLLQEGHLWEAEECYAVAFEDFRFASHIRNSEEHHHHHHDARKQSTGSARRSVGASHHNHDAANRMDVAWAMYGVTAGHKLWSRLAGLCRSGKNKDIRSVLNFKCGRKQLRPVGRPDYTIEDVSDIKKPWEMSSMEMSQSGVYDPMTTDMSEASWEEGFLFASTKKKKKRVFKVGFDSAILDATTLDEEVTTMSTSVSTDRISRSRSMQMNAGVDKLDEIMQGTMDDLTAEPEPDKAKESKSQDRATQQMERDRRMRQSVANVLAARRSTYGSGHTALAPESLPKEKEDTPPPAEGDE